MPNNPGRDQVWTPQIWGEIDKAVQEEVGRIRVARKAFPTLTLDGALNVPDDSPTVDTMTIPEGKTKPFTEISIEFTLTEAQVDNEASLRLGRTLARLAAKSLAEAEDILIFRGSWPFQAAQAEADQRRAFQARVKEAQALQALVKPVLADPGQTPRRLAAQSLDGRAQAALDLARRELASLDLAAPGKGLTLDFLANIRIANGAAADKGLLEIVPDHHKIPVDRRPPPPGTARGTVAPGPVYGEITLAKVIDGITRLISAGQPGPYALILESSIYADTFSPLKDSLGTPADRITPLLSGGFHVTGMLPDKTGLLVSLGGEPTVLYTSKSTSQDVTTVFTRQDEGGNYRFRVSERVQFVVRDPRALVRLDFR